ncbi:MAG: SDR family NAD(P)-dependent oxidoreductase [bacterium]|nr:short-chain dehydrogenase [Deltaproteobacteria bacterium]MCP4907020.1 SDR family NAD(P)-dependent oxidoreductase [bacterium]
MGELDGRVVLVTGASRGIGAAIAKRFAAEGARVAITARTLDQHAHLVGSLSETAAIIEAAGGKVAPIVGDLADSTCLEDLVKQAESELGPIEVLVNNAAAAFYLPFTETSEKRFRVANDINFFAPWRLSQLVVPGMRERGEGWILNISSATSYWPKQPFQDFDATSILYGSTKAALERFTTGLAAALAKEGIWVNSMAPLGAVPTEGTEALGIVPEEALAIAESREAMAEASLALCVTRDPAMNGRITFCTPILDELARKIFTVDGKTELAGPRENQAVAFR